MDIGSPPEWLVVLTTEIRSMMLFPNDNDASKFLDALYAKAFIELIPELSTEEKREISVEIGIGAGLRARDYDEIAERGLTLRSLQSIGLDIFPGKFVGDAILLIFAAFCQNKMIGVGKIYRCYKSNKNGNIEKTLSDIWSKYKNVAHLWAAFLICDGIPNDPVGLLNFISFAELLRRWAVKYKPERARETLLSEDDAVSLFPEIVVPVELPMASLEPSAFVLETLGISPPFGKVYFTAERLLFTSE